MRRNRLPLVLKALEPAFDVDVVDDHRGFAVVGNGYMAFGAVAIPSSWEK